MKSRQALVLTVVAASLLILFASVPATKAAPATVVVKILSSGDSYYGASYSYSPDPVKLVIGVNNTVTWMNTDTTSHTATSATGAFDSGNLSPGKSYTFTFTNPGTFHYACDYHPQLTGTITVVQQAASSTKTTSTATSTTTSTTSTTTTTSPIPEFPNGGIAVAILLLFLAGGIAFLKTPRKSP